MKFICMTCGYILSDTITNCPKCKNRMEPVKKIAESALLSFLDERNDNPVGRIFAESYLSNTPEEKKDVLELIEKLNFPLSED